MVTSTPAAATTVSNNNQPLASPSVRAVAKVESSSEQKGSS